MAVRRFPSREEERYMCGRYQTMTPDELKNLYEVVRETERNLYDLQDEIRTHPTAYPGEMEGIYPSNRGIIYPTDRAVVVQDTGGDLLLRQMRWGFPGYVDKKNPGAKPRPLINTRSETAASLVTWKDALKNRRCAVPAKEYYEWDKGRPKKGYAFSLPESTWFFMAGLYTEIRKLDGSKELRFSVLTTSANSSVADVHDRMPVVILPGELMQWLSGDYSSLFDRSHILFERSMI